MTVRKSEEMRLVVIETLDVLGVALAGHGHSWSKRERGLYERASKWLKRQRSKEQGKP